MLIKVEIPEGSFVDLIIGQIREISLGRTGNIYGGRNGIAVTIIMASDSYIMTVELIHRKISKTFSAIIAYDLSLRVMISMIERYYNEMPNKTLLRFPFFQLISGIDWDSIPVNVSCNSYYRDYKWKEFMIRFKVNKSHLLESLLYVSDEKIDSLELFPPHDSLSAVMMGYYTGLIAVHDGLRRVSNISMKSANKSS